MDCPYMGGLLGLAILEDSPGLGDCIHDALCPGLGTSSPALPHSEDTPEFIPRTVGRLSPVQRGLPTWQTVWEPF